MTKTTDAPKKKRAARLFFRLDPPSPSQTRVPAFLLLCFAAAGALFLWTPTQRLWESAQRFAIFRDIRPTAAKPAPDAPGFLEKALPASPETAAPSKEPRAVTFRLLAPAAKEVLLGGTFNDFHASKDPLARRDDGVWERTMTLEPGQYFYKFKVDGHWTLDPTNVEKTPEPRASSILVIR